MQRGELSRRSLLHRSNRFHSTSFVGEKGRKEEKVAYTCIGEPRQQRCLPSGIQPHTSSARSAYTLQSIERPWWGSGDSTRLRLAPTRPNSRALLAAWWGTVPCGTTATAAAAATEPSRAREEGKLLAAEPRGGESRREESRDGVTALDRTEQCRAAHQVLQRPARGRPEGDRARGRRASWRERRRNPRWFVMRRDGTATRSARGVASYETGPHRPVASGRQPSGKCPHIYSLCIRLAQPGPVHGVAMRPAGRSLVDLSPSFI